MPNSGSSGSRMPPQPARRGKAEGRPAEIARRVLESFDPREREALVVYYLELVDPETIEKLFKFTKEEFRMLRHRARELYKRKLKSS